MLTRISDNHTSAMKQNPTLRRYWGFTIRLHVHLVQSQVLDESSDPIKYGDSVGSPSAEASSAYCIWETSILANFWIRGTTPRAYIGIAPWVVLLGKVK